MKNRTLIGVLCMVLAVVLTFVVAPMVTTLTTDTVSVARIAKNVNKGAKISEADIETVSVKKDSLPSGVITDKDEVIGHYAATNLYAGDYLNDAKITGNANTADDVISALNGEQFAMSFTIDSFAAGLSGKMQNGDIISLVIVDRTTGKSSLPAAFKYVKVITTTTDGGVDRDKIVTNEDGSFEAPATVTLLVNETQAKLLAEYEQSTINCVLVYRGNTQTAQKFLDTQAEYFKTSAKVSQQSAELNETEDKDTTPAEETQVTGNE